MRSEQCHLRPPGPLGAHRRKAVVKDMSWRFYVTDVSQIRQGSQNRYYQHNGVEEYLFEDDERGLYFNVHNNDRLEGLPFSVDEFCLFSFRGFLDCAKRERGIYKEDDVEAELVYLQRYTKAPTEPHLALTTTDVLTALVLIEKIKAGAISPYISYEEGQAQNNPRGSQSLLAELTWTYRCWQETRLREKKIRRGVGQKSMRKAKKAQPVKPDPLYECTVCHTRTTKSKLAWNWPLRGCPMPGCLGHVDPVSLEQTK